MVTKGQYLERPTLVPVKGVTLEALWHRGGRAPPLLIIPPLPGEGSMDHAAAAELAWAAARAGFPSLRFNFRGVGASQGERTGLAGWREDIEAAALLLEESAGVGFTARIYLRGAAAAALGRKKGPREVRGICLLEPTGIDPERLTSLAPSPWVIRGAETAGADSDELGQVVARAGGRLELIPGADQRFLRNLPEVGKRAVEWLETLEAATTLPVREA